MTLVPVSPLANSIPTEVVPLGPRDVQHAALAQGQASSRQGPQHNTPVQAGENRQETGVHFGCLFAKQVKIQVPCCSQFHIGHKYQFCNNIYMKYYNTIHSLTNLDKIQFS